MDQIEFSEAVWYGQSDIMLSSTRHRSHSLKSRARDLCGKRPTSFRPTPLEPNIAELLVRTNVRLNEIERRLIALEVSLQYKASLIIEI
jgi:hypothetical protein